MVFPPEVGRAGIALQERYGGLREELRQQLRVLEEQRDEISSQLQDPMVSGANRAGLSTRIENLDGRIVALDRQLADVDAAVATAGTVARVRIAPQGESRSGPPEAPFVLGALFIMCVLLPISIAYARRIWRRGSEAVSSLPREISERLTRMDQGLDAIALEVERIGEGQRFLTRAFTEQQQISAGPADRIEAPDREKERHRRGP